MYQHFRKIGGLFGTFLSSYAVVISPASKMCLFRSSQSLKASVSEQSQIWMEDIKDKEKQKGGEDPNSGCA